MVDYEKDFDGYVGSSRETVRELLKPGLRRYTLAMLHTRIFAINSFRPLDKSGKIDGASLDKHIQRELLELPKFKYISYIRVNGDPVKIRIEYPNFEAIEWTPREMDMPRKERERLSDISEIRGIMRRDIETERRDFELLKKLTPKQDPKKYSAAIMDQREKDNLYQKP